MGRYQQRRWAIFQPIPLIAVAILPTDEKWAAVSSEE